MHKRDKGQYIGIAGEEHLQAIVEIYQLVQIDPALFYEIAELRDDRPDPLRTIKSLGGFICPPDEHDMELTVNHGLILVCVQNGDVVAYNRIVTQADKVHQEFCTELQLDQSLREIGKDQFTDWAGSKELHTGKVLKCIHWIDRDQALLAFDAAIAGLEGKHSGKLAWSIDTAVHPGSRKQGFSSSLINHLNKTLRPEYQYRIFKIFEILKINNTDIVFSNKRSEKTIVEDTSRRFAYTEEDIKINSTLMLRVRWNYWLRYH